MSAEGNGTDPGDEREPAIRLRIAPEPAEDELAAILIVLAALPNDEAAVSPSDPPVSRWAMAGRRAALAVGNVVADSHRGCPDRTS